MAQLRQGSVVKLHIPAARSTAPCRNCRKLAIPHMRDGPRGAAQHPAAVRSRSFSTYPLLCPATRVNIARSREEHWMTGATARQDRVKYLFIWPAFLVVLVISLFPLIYALTVSFQTVRIVPADPAALRRASTTTPRSRPPPASGGRSGPPRSSPSSRSSSSTCSASRWRWRSTTTCRDRRSTASSFLLPMFLAPVGVALIARMVFHPYLGPVNDLMERSGFAYVPFLTEAVARDHGAVGHRHLAMDALRHAPDARGPPGPAAGGVRGRARRQHRRPGGGSGRSPSRCCCRSRSRWCSSG